jgi:hypothetical protein
MIYCGQQMSEAEAWQRYALLGGAAVGATKICCDQQMSPLPSIHADVYKCLNPRSAIARCH